ncbi:hypothetical protein SD70_15730 [Gordoniibacillus kamchatkensis]|uniref:SLH domain-containing protein n=1 Tax=Gordoniibacillus kamchatkensis TaxID=1590651 RepID=A0ABR5AGE4_9BACL|nr:S-layer homology domain-containing protein [Paenibacillus sp. VKM B-2647]KIL40125.1 hypothetical protein SD70_15730 [Paenibacillus sp. VKM B-2647]
MKRVLSAVLAAATIISTSSVAFAEDNVSKSVYGGPRCDKGVKLGNKHCVPFDVPDNSPVSSSIVHLVQAGLMVGYEDGSFRPDNPLNMAEAATVLLRLLGMPPKEDTADWAAAAIADAAKLGLVPVDTQADAPLTRLKVAIVLAKALKLKPSTDALPFTDLSGLSDEEKGLLAALVKAGIFSADAGKEFGPDTTITRGEMASIIERVLAKYK